MEALGNCCHTSWPTRCQLARRRRRTHSLGHSPNEHIVSFFFFFLEIITPHLQSLDSFKSQTLTLTLPTNDLFYKPLLIVHSLLKGEIVPTVVFAKQSDVRTAV